LKSLLENNSVDVVGVVTKKRSSFNSDFCDLVPACEQYDIPICFVEQDWKETIKPWLTQKKPDVVFCIGWSFLLPEELLNLAPYGTVGFHPAALPLNRGRHPIIWALALGLTETASTFFRMDSGTDSGPILNQLPIYINDGDDATSLYVKILDVIPFQINEIVQNYIKGTLKPQPQNDEKANYWRKRCRSDGIIDWRMSARSIHNLVRALTRPYVGAEFEIDDIVVKVWKTELVCHVPVNAEPGKVLQVNNKGILVKAGEDAIYLIQIEPYIEAQIGDYL